MNLEKFKTMPAIANVIEKIASFFGEKSDIGVTKEVPSKDELNDLFAHYPLSSFLHYEHFDQETSLFYNKKGIGFILEASLLTGASQETENILASIVTDVLPNDADVQFLLWACDKIGGILDAFKKTRGQKDIYQWLSQKRVEFLGNGTKNSLSSNGTYILRDFQLFIAVSLPKGQGEAYKLIDIRDNIISEIMTIERFLSVTSDILNPSTNIYPTEQNWNEHETLSQQIVNPETRLRVYPDKLLFEQTGETKETIEVRCFAVKDYPKTAALWKMTDNIGQLFNISLQIPCPFIISLNIHAIDFEKAVAQAQLKFMDKDKTARSPLAKFKPTMGKEYEDWALIRERLTEGDRLVKAFYQVVMFTDPAKANGAERKIRDLYRANGWKLSKLAYIQLQSFLAMLPMRMTEGMYKDLKMFGRLRTMTAFNAVNIAPIQGEWKGTKTPSLILPGRRGQIAIWNPFDNNEGNFNIAIAAKAGSGKSVFTQEYIVSLLGCGGRTWVIDVGRSYEKTCKMLGGEFIEFKQDSIVSLNPFTFIKNFDESIVMLKPLFAAMARPVSRASEEESAFLEKAIKAAWQAHGNKATITIVCKWLNAQEDERCKNLGHLLHTYSVDGMYGKYFEGDCTINVDNPFVVLELQELKTKKDLQKVVLLVLMYQISESMYMGSRSQVKSCVIDEAWDLLGGDNDGAASFIETGYRTARKHNANFVTVTQSINDYYKNETSKAAFENSDNKIILSQSPETIEDLKRTNRFSIDPFTEKLLKSLKKTDEYSECVIRGASGSSVHRILLDHYSRILYSSKGTEFEEVNQLQVQGLTLQEAIAQVAFIKFQKGASK
jgi:conjugal transfer ATP-binding protein TraC